MIIPFVLVRKAEVSPRGVDEVIPCFIEIHTNLDLSMEVWGGETRTSLTFGNGGVAETVSKAGEGITAKVHELVYTDLAARQFITEWIERHAETYGAKIQQKSDLISRVCCEMKISVMDRYDADSGDMLHILLEKNKRQRSQYNLLQIENRKLQNKLLSVSERLNNVCSMTTNDEPIGKNVREAMDIIADMSATEIEQERMWFFKATGKSPEEWLIDWRTGKTERNTTTYTLAYNATFLEIKEK